MSFMRKADPKPELATHPTGTLTKVLSSILGASPKQIQVAHDAAKKEKFSSHMRLKYVPAKRA